MKNKSSSIPRTLDGCQRKLISAGLCCFMFPGAISLAAEDGGATKQLALEEVVVTARKREESLQDAPISIAAFSGADLEARQTSSISEIGSFTPNLVFDAAAPISGSNAAASIFIRGIGQTDFTFTTDPGVGLYVDGVYLARSVGGVLDLLDVERVEVLRGPQGTLFGRNTIGGAINLVSKKPSTEFGGNIAATVGTDNRIDLEGSIDIPITESLLSKFSLLSKNRDGYVTRLYDGVELGDNDSLSGRASFLWNATEQLSLDLTIDGTRAREETAPNTLIDVDGTAMPFSGLFNNAIVGGNCAPAPGSLDDPACYNQQWVTDSEYKTHATSESRSDYDVIGAALTINYEFDWASLKSITAYRDMDAFFYRDADHSPHQIFETENDMEHEQLSQEFQLVGTGFDDRMNWIVGLYYFQEEGTDINNILTSVIDFQSGGSIDNDTTAIFTQVTYDLTDKLSLTGGLRYSDETKRFLPDQFVTDSGFLGVPVGTPLLPSIEEEIAIDETTPMVNLSYQWTEDVMVYGSYSEGFKSGGFTQRVFPPRSEIPTFLPEFAETYELGAKTTLMDGRIRLNGAVFFTEYADMQVVVQDAIASSTQNAAEAEIFGFELELKALLTESLGLDAGVGYVDAEYTKVSPDATEITVDKEFVNTPEWSLNASLYYDYQMEDRGTLSPRLDWSYRSEVYNNSINSENIVQDGYHLLNAYLSYEDAAMNWIVTFGVKNLTDERYFSSAYNNPSIGYSEALWAREREWSLKIQRQF